MGIPESGRPRLPHASCYHRDSVRSMTALDPGSVALARSVRQHEFCPNGQRSCRKKLGQNSCRNFFGTPLGTVDLVHRNRLELRHVESVRFRSSTAGGLGETHVGGEIAGCLPPVALGSRAGSGDAVESTSDRRGCPARRRQPRTPQVRCLTARPGPAGPLDRSLPPPLTSARGRPLVAGNAGHGVPQPFPVPQALRALERSTVASIRTCARRGSPRRRSYSHSV